jgi:hypothetical protein
MEKLGSHWTDFIKFDILGFFENMPRTFKVSLKSGNNNGRLM